MEKLKNQKTTVEVSLKDSLDDWKSLVAEYEELRRKRDYRFWEESWNEGNED